MQSLFEKTDRRRNETLDSARYTVHSLSGVEMADTRLPSAIDDVPVGVACQIGCRRSLSLVEVVEHRGTWVAVYQVYIDSLEG